MKLRSQGLCQDVLFGLIEIAMGKYQSRNIFEKVEEELSPVWDIITLLSLLVIQVKFFGKTVEYASLKISYISRILGLEVHAEMYGI